MQRGRGKSKNIKNGIKAGILYVKTMHNDWSANRIREYLLNNHVRFNLEKTDIPVVRSIYNVIERNPTALTDMRVVVSSEQFKGLEIPWHLGLMSKPEYDIPPEAVPYILIVQDWAGKHPNVFNQPHEPLTVRQALWVSRLYGHVAYLRRIKPKWDFKYFLFQWSEAYACRERICELSDTPFDSSGLDKGIIDGGLPTTAGDSALINYPDKSFSIDTIDKDLLQQMEQMKKDGEA